MNLPSQSAMAWLSGSGFSALAPTDPRSGNAALAPTDPRAGSGGAWAPTDPRAGYDGAWAPTDPRGRNTALAPTDPRGHAVSPNAPVWPQPTPAPPPHEGVDPPWVYTGPAALLGQALRKSRAKITRQSDILLQADAEAAAARKGRPIQGTHLWRWAPEFRVKTIACQLLGRCQVRGRAIWLLEEDPAVATPVFSLESPTPEVSRDEQVDKVLRAATEREDRLPEILSQAANFWPFYESIIGTQLAAAPRLAELLDVVDDWALHLLMALKHACAARRPVQESSLVMPVIPTPGHGSMPSGHATMAALTSELLGHLLYPRKGERCVQLDRLARRIAFNRVVAGVHFPVDSQVGHALGRQLAHLLMALAGELEMQPEPLMADAILKSPFELDELAASHPRKGRPKPTYPLQPLDTLRALWLQVKAELVEQRI